MICPNHSLRVLQLPILAPSLGRRAGFGHFCRASWAGHSCKLPIKYNRGRSDRGLFYSMSVTVVFVFCFDEVKKIMETPKLLEKSLKE